MGRRDALAGDEGKARPLIPARVQSLSHLVQIYALPIRPYVPALRVLLADVPEPSCERVAKAVLDSIEEGFADAAEEAPRWLEVLRRRIARQV